jgi:hypothetical protein
MKKYCADGQIVLSNKRLKDLVKVLKVGDYIPVSVIRRLEKDRYRIKLQGLELVGVFRGVLPSDSMFYAVIQAVSPHVILKLIANDASIQRRVDSLSKVIQTTHGSYSLQPFMGEIIASFMTHGAELGEAIANNKKTYGSFDQVDERIIKPMRKALFSEWALGQTDFSLDAIVSRFHQVVIDTKEKLDQFCEDPDYSHDLIIQALLNDMSKECDDLILQIILQQSAQIRDPRHQAFGYYQMPAVLNGEIGSLEIYIFSQADEGKKECEVWIHTEKSCFFGQGTIDLKKKNIRFCKLMYPKEQLVAFDSLLERLKGSSLKRGWIVETDVFLTGSGAGEARYPVRPQAINIRSIQHFTIVA